jgi:hypothetical protein
MKLLFCLRPLAYVGYPTCRVPGRRTEQKAVPPAIRTLIACRQELRANDQKGRGFPPAQRKNVLRPFVQFAWDGAPDQNPASIASCPIFPLPCAGGSS